MRKIPPMRPFFLTLAALLGVCAALAQTSALLSPEQFMPHPYGRQFTPHHLLVDYVGHLDAHSDRVEVESYGRSTEGRPLLLAFLSTPENLARRESIRSNHLRAIGYEEGAPAPEKPLAIVWLSFGVHGNEAAAPESAMAVLHALADPASGMGSFLENTLVIVDPSLNPDGYDRYTNWYRQVAPLEPDPLSFAAEHREPWPGGRPNHYLFDLNRDWAWGTQAETRQRLVHYQRWMPHIHADFHEQFPNSPYFFAPAAEPMHPAVTEWQRQFQAEIGKANARKFDEEGWLYFTRELFDLFYPSYGDTYPTFSGAIGMTYEQAGHGIAGRAFELENGDLLTLADRIDHHTAAALAAVETASGQAETLDREFRAYFQRAQTRPSGEYKAFVAPHTNRPDQMKAFTRFLDLHQIRYGKAGKKYSMEAWDYASATAQTAQIDPDDLVVSVYQPAGVLARVLLEPSAQLSDSLTYDITAWSAIHAFGLEAWALTQRLEPGEAWTTPAYDAPQWPASAYAYLLPWTSIEDARFLGALLKEGIGVRVAGKPFRLNGRDFERGTLVITRADNRRMEGFHERVKDLALAHERHLVALQSGFAETGSDLGSENMHFLPAPRVALLSGEPVSSSSFGATWYYFEQVLRYPVSVIPAQSFRASVLEHFDVLILPEGDYSWGEGMKSELSEWMRAGGRIIATGGALKWVQQLDGVHLTSKEAFQAPKKEVEERGGTPIRFEDRNRDQASNRIPGTLFRAAIDNSHPMGFGFPDHYFSLKTGTLSYAYLEKGWNTCYLEKDPHYLGFAGENALKKVEESLIFGEERVGRGAAVYLVDDPLFRAFWHNGHLLFANALFFSGL